MMILFNILINNIKMSDKFILIDIRNSDEVLFKHFDSNKMNNFYNIPANMIRFNKKVILSHLDYVDLIYLVCNSSKRSQFIKNKYFSDEPRVVVDELLQFQNFNKSGEYNLVLKNNKNIKVFINGTFKYNFYNLTRIIQTILGSIMIIVGLYLLKNKKCNTNIPLYILLLFGINALINGLTNTCTISLVFKNLLN
jgi:rhodanese-related sulfurtransferase